MQEKKRLIPALGSSPKHTDRFADGVCDMSAVVNIRVCHFSSDEDIIAATKAITRHKGVYVGGRSGGECEAVLSWQVKAA